MFFMSDRKTIREAQGFVRDFARNNGWEDVPNIDKFDHLHEELIEMSSKLRYRTEEERKQVIREEKEIFVDGVGDLFFGLCRLANQLDVDVEEAFDVARNEILTRYDGKAGEEKLT